MKVIGNKEIIITNNGEGIIHLDIFKPFRSKYISSRVLAEVKLTSQQAKELIELLQKEVSNE